MENSGRANGTAEPDLAEPAEGEVQRYTDEDVEVEYVQPAQLAVDEIGDCAEDIGGGVGEQERQADEDGEESSRPEGHLRVDVEAHPNDVAVSGLPVRNIWIEVDVRVDLQPLERLAIVDRLLSKLLLLRFPVVERQSRLGQIDVGVVGTAADPRICGSLVVGVVHDGPPLGGLPRWSGCSHAPRREPELA